MFRKRIKKEAKTIQKESVRYMYSDFFSPGNDPDRGDILQRYVEIMDSEREFFTPI